jgi:hypothetical protein
MVLTRYASSKKVRLSRHSAVGNFSIDIQQKPEANNPQCQA